MLRNSVQSFRELKRRKVILLVIGFPLALAHHALEQRAARDHDAGVQFVRVDPLLESLRSDPRWPAFLTRLGLTG